MKKIRRSKVNYSIKTAFQLRLFLKILFIIFMSITVTSGIFYIYANREIGNSFKLFHINATNFLDYLLPAVLTAMVGGFFIALAMTVFFPHHIAGPLYRIERELKERIGNGDMTVRFYLREGDELKDLAEALNMAIERIGSKIRDIESVSNDLSRLTSRNALPSTEEFREIKNIHYDRYSLVSTEELIEIKKRLEEAVQKFKIQQTPHL